MISESKTVRMTPLRYSSPCTKQELLILIRPNLIRFYTKCNCKNSCLNLNYCQRGGARKMMTTKDDGYLSFFAMSNSVRPDTSKAELSLYSSIYILAKVSHLKWRFPVNLTEFRDRPDLPHLLFTKNPNFSHWNWSIKNRLSKIVCWHKPSWYLPLWKSWGRLIILNCTERKWFILYD